jgi:hypothetical protein
MQISFLYALMLSKETIQGSCASLQKSRVVFILEHILLWT